MQYTIHTTIQPLVQFAASYDCNAYGRGTYNNAECSTAVDPNTPPQDGGLLPDTGWNIIIPVTFALALILAALILFTKKLIRRYRKS
jgi:hypothetical protein